MNFASRAAVVRWIGGMLLLALAVPAWAQRQGNQGYGVMVGNPSGLSGKYWLDETFAMDGAVGVAQGEFDVHLTMLVHSFRWYDRMPGIKKSLNGLISRGELPFFFGVGPRLLFEDKEEFGIRVPVGLSYLPNESQWEIFGEIAPVIRLTPDGGVDGDFALGVRYYFEAIRPRSD